MPVWAIRLRDLREKEGLTRPQLAALAALSPATVKAYERGERNPSRRLLSALLDALKADLFTRSEIMAAAGFAPDGRTPSERIPDEWFSLEESVAEIAASPLPACVSSEVMEVLAANSLMQQVWDVDLNVELQGAFERSMLSMLSRARVGDRIVNWDEAIRLVVGIVKGHYGGDDVFLGGGNPYFKAAIEHFLGGEPRYVQRFLALWEVVPPTQHKLRFAYPVVWDHPRVGTLRFRVLVNPADGRGSIVFQDWVPLDAETWAGLALLAGQDAAPALFVSSAR